MTTRRIEPLAAPPDATVRMPGSKSLTNRALVCAATANGASVLEGALRADDTEAMIEALGALGVEIQAEGSTISVVGTEGKVPPGPATLRARLSGTTARFLAPLLAAGTGPYLLDGDEGLRRRPMGQLVEALRTIGAGVEELGAPGALPFRITGRARGGEVRLPGHVSSQFVSGLLLAGPLLDEGVRVALSTPPVSLPYVEMTRGVMGAFGVHVDGTTVEPGRYRATSYAIEGDASAASYFFAAAAITGGRVRVDGLGRQALQGDIAFVDILEQMGAEVQREMDSTTVVGTGVLHGIEANLVDLSDTAQTLAAVAVFAEEATTVRGIGFIRNKESNRIADTVRELTRCGIRASEEPDGFTIHPGQPAPARIRTYDDHRMAMSFALLGLRAEGIEICDPGCVSKTYPRFFDDLDLLRQ